MNLAVNARDAMPDGGTLAIAVSGRRRATATRDRGSRSPTPAPAWTRRGRASARSSRSSRPRSAGEGTGLGLATVHGIVTESGGTVEIDSAPGRGTVVSIDLPGTRRCAVPPEESTDDAERRAPRERRAGARRRGPGARSAARRAGSSSAHGYAVTEARARRRGAGGWAADRRAVTDVVMPGMTGHELAERAARADARPAGRLHVRPHRGHRRPRRGPRRRHRLRAEAVHARRRCCARSRR